MKKVKLKEIILIGLSIVITVSFKNVYSCTNILVSKGASADGSTFISYAADAGGFMEPLYFSPAKEWPDNTYVDIYEWDTGKYLGKIKQVSRTYQVIGNMNEWQVSIGETTFGGREELRDTTAILDYGSLMYITLQRAKTAREAIKIMTDLVNEYGYYSTGESFSIADPNEVWILEMISKGKHEKGAVWVARRVPDGYICAHANQARISDFPLNDKENCLYSPDVISFAIKMKYYDPSSGKPFSFRDAYCPLDPSGARYCEGRVWSIFNRAAPSLKLKPDYWRAVKGAEPYPLFIKPDKKLTVSDVFYLMRDHFDGTPWDQKLEQPVAGPYGCPVRWKPLSWKIEGDTTQYGWERPISTQQTAFSFVAQARAHLPREVGGVFWYGVDDTYGTCYMPLYCCITEPPAAYQVGSILRFDWNSPHWVFNLLNNYSYSKYSYIHKDIQKLQKELETKFVTFQPFVEKTAMEILKTDRNLALSFLTDYSISQANLVFDKFKELCITVITRYNDGYINDGDHGGRRPKSTGYSQELLKEIVKKNPERYKTMWKDKPE